MGLNLTEKELNELLTKNKKLKVSNSMGGNKKLNVKEKTLKLKKFSLSENDEDQKEKKKVLGVNVSDLNNINKNSISKYSNSKDHVSILLEGAKLLSVNQIFAILQYRKYEIFKYKKVWHEIIKNSLDIQSYELNKKGENLPFFEDTVEITLFRQATRLVDEDAMSTMFKYIIDGLKRDPIKNPNGILAEDNPKIVHRIVCFSEKGEPLIGIKIKKLKEKKKTFSALEILQN